MRLRFIVVFVVLLASCGDVRSFEETSAQFQQDRDQLRQLALTSLECENASRFDASASEGAGCVGEIARELDRLGYDAALVDEGRWRVAFVNGDDGTAVGNVISGIAYYRAPRAPRNGERPLTAPPHQWFYFQHD
jgi:hypothetical protein